MVSELFDQFLAEVIVVDATAISTPLESVPLYEMQPSPVSMILLKSSQAVSSSDRFSLGTPACYTTQFCSPYMKQKQLQGIAMFNKSGAISHKVHVFRIISI